MKKLQVLLVVVLISLFFSTESNAKVHYIDATLELENSEWCNYSREVIFYAIDEEPQFNLCFYIKIDKNATLDTFIIINSPLKQGLWYDGEFPLGSYDSLMFIPEFTKTSELSCKFNGNLLTITLINANTGVKLETPSCNSRPDFHKDFEKNHKTSMKDLKIAKDTTEYLTETENKDSINATYNILIPIPRILSINSDIYWYEFIFFFGDSVFNIISSILLWIIIILSIKRCYQEIRSSFKKKN